MYTGLETINGSIYNISLPLGSFNESDVQTLELFEKLLQFTAYTNDNLDDFFFIMNGVLVLFMQVGFACLEAGSVRYKNVGNIMLKNFLDSLICSIVFWLTGYAIAFGNGNAYIGWTWFAGVNFPDNLWSKWFFQYTFASTAGTILSGAVAERSTFIAYLSYSLFMSGFIYPVAVHWTWTYQGWLKQLGFIDYAGGMLIHGVAGTACLVAAILIGPRIGRFDKNSKNSFSSHSNALIGIGSIIILVGFCGFNAGTLSNFSKPHDGIIATIIVRNTIMCGAGGALTTLFLGKFGAFNDKYWHFEFTVNGGIAGLVASCAGCDQFSPLESIIVGIFAAFIYTILHHVILYFKIDDPLDSSPIHMGCGIWSVISVPLIQHGGIFAHPINEVLQNLMIQIIGVLSITAWSLCTCLILFGILHLLNLLRCSEKSEIIGLDVASHNQKMYPDYLSNSEFVILKTPHQ